MDFKVTKENGLWIMPTRRRPQNLMRFFRAYKKTEATTPGVLVIDREDYKDMRMEYAAVVQEYFPDNWDIVICEAETQGDKQRHMMTDKRYKTASWIGTLNDDAVPVTPHWDVLTISKLNGKNIVSGNDNWQGDINGRMTGAIAFSKDILTAMGGMFPNNFHHFYADDMMEMVGRDGKCWVVDKTIITHHYHHMNGNAQYDSTYAKADSLTEHDRMQWRKWLVNDYVATMARIKNVVEG